MGNILEKVHTGGIGNRDTGFVQVIDSCDAGTAAQSGCLIERAVESITESLQAGIFRVCFMHDQPGDVPFTEMIDDYTVRNRDKTTCGETSESSVSISPMESLKL